MKAIDRRWYDKNKMLARQIDRLANVHPEKKYSVIDDLMSLVAKSQPDILHRFTIPTDIERWHRRWYDKDPVYWLVINSLKYADDELLEKAAKFLENQLASLIGPA